MAVSVYDILTHTQEIEDQHETFKQCASVLPVECNKGARIFKNFGDTIKEIIHSGAPDLPAGVSQLHFISKLYFVQEKALEIERAFYKFRAVCLDDNKKKEDLYEALYRKLSHITKELDKVAGLLPDPKKNPKITDIADTAEIGSCDDSHQATPQSIPSFTRTSTSTF